MKKYRKRNISVRLSCHLPSMMLHLSTLYTLHLHSQHTKKTEKLKNLCPEVVFHSPPYRCHCSIRFSTWHSPFNSFPIDFSHVWRHEGISANDDRKNKYPLDIISTTHGKCNCAKQKIHVFFAISDNCFARFISFVSKCFVCCVVVYATSTRFRRVLSL